MQLCSNAPALRFHAFGLSDGNLESEAFEIFLSQFQLVPFELAQFDLRLEIIAWIVK